MPGQRPMNARKQPQMGKCRPQSTRDNRAYFVAAATFTSHRASENDGEALRSPDGPVAAADAAATRLALGATATEVGLVA
jgi:hypothetical protein